MSTQSLWWARVPLVLFRTWGIRGLFLRLSHELRRATGGFRAHPKYPPREGSPPLDAFRVSMERLQRVVDRGASLVRADRVVNGEYQAFGGEWRSLPCATSWHENPLTGTAYRSKVPWWKVPHLASGGDVKDGWEPARFSWIYDLVRGFALTGDEIYARAFYELSGDWISSNPPFKGVHWSCGQETALRALAVLVGEANLPNSTPEEATRISGLLSASGERIADALGYARSQRNNHAISEATGLVLLGVRFHGTHPEAQRWLDTGHRVLGQEVTRQFAEDGWYIQHSFTYLRLALEQALLARRTLRGVGRVLPTIAEERLRAGATLLAEVMDRSTGAVPNHGANDGTWLLPIGNLDIRDMRPTLTLAALELGWPLPEDLAPDRAVLAWFGEGDVSRGPARPEGVRSGASGWASGRVGPFQFFLRAGTYASRPSHLDPLHLDVRVNGREVLVDPGTFSYNREPPWRNGLASALVHNGPVLDGEEPARRGPRFLWLSWPEAEITRVQSDPDETRLEAEIPGRVRRTVRLDARGLEVLDEVLAGSPKTMEVSWTVPPGTAPDCMDVRPEPDVVPAIEGSVEGWVSPTYGVLQAGTLLRTSVKADRGAQIISRIPVAESQDVRLDGAGGRS